MTIITAKVVADSMSLKSGTRLTTLELRYPRFIHAELLTHRQFSRNAQSNRAIPVEKVLNDIKVNPVIPIHWGVNKPGMVADTEIDPKEKIYVEMTWRDAANDAYANALHLAGRFGIHKQIVNRLIEPYQHITTIVTATEWTNFLELRLAADAEPHIRKLANEICFAMDSSDPETLEPGEWHLPYITNSDWEKFNQMLHEDSSLNTEEMAVKCSVARCARCSYLNHNNSNPDIQKDLALYDKLLSSRHMSPFEHVVTPFTEEDYMNSQQAAKFIGEQAYFRYNLREWKSHRWFLENNYKITN